MSTRENIRLIARSPLPSAFLKACEELQSNAKCSRLGVFYQCEER